MEECKKHAREPFMYSIYKFMQEKFVDKAQKICMSCKKAVKNFFGHWKNATSLSIAR